MVSIHWLLVQQGLGERLATQVLVKSRKSSSVVCSSSKKYLESFASLLTEISAQVSIEIQMDNLYYCK